MTPEQLLHYHDRSEFWPTEAVQGFTTDMAQAYQTALGVRQLRLARGEACVGYKVGFTNQANWPKQGVDAPMWSSMWASGLVFSDEGRFQLDLSRICTPRLEPEIIFGLRATPAPDASPQALFECIDWIAPGFEIVRCNAPGGKATAVQAVADGGMHAALLVGRRTPVRQFAADAAALDRLLAQATLTLSTQGETIAQGQGTIVLGSPLQALHQFLAELRRCPGAPTLQAGEVVTSGTWTDAMLVAAGETWTARLTDGLGEVEVSFT